MGLKAARICGAIAALIGAAAAAQPGAVEPVSVPMRGLVWGKLNFLHTTDTHGWHGGHLQESQYSADWGDYVSFAEHMRRSADDRGVDLLLVDTGDRVEGNGLYDASDPKGRYYYDIYRQQDVDIICTGNHELYQAGTADEEHRQTVPNFRNNYIASNLDYVDPDTGKRQPMAQRYRKFQTKNQKINIVAFGFLFDFTGNANNTVVQPVRETVREPWFQQAIRENPDVFVVIGHVGVRMPEFKNTIFNAIRKQNPLTPIVFFGGHVHVRDATAYDERSFALASGRYFETIGWMSVDGPLKAAASLSPRSPPPKPRFHRRYIDNNLLGQYYHTGLNASTFPTERGRAVTAAIARARDALDLDSSFGCAPRDYWMTRVPYPHEASIYSLLEHEILPAVATGNPSREGVPRLVLMNTGAVRFDIFRGPFTTDTTYIVSPFLSVLNYIPDVPYAAAREVLGMLNGSDKILEEDDADTPPMPPKHLMAIPEQQGPRPPTSVVDPAGVGDGQRREQKPLHGLKGAGDGDDDDDSNHGPYLVEGYTTRDDMGDDGDDALHANINFYDVPNCIQAEVGLGEASEPETVDLVFMDFIQPWILMALRFRGAKYTAADVKPYVDGTFTELIAGWIKENWPKKCE